jgi:hypothetical protein
MEIFRIFPMLNKNKQTPASPELILILELILFQKFNQFLKNVVSLKRNKMRLCLYYNLFV